MRDLTDQDIEHSGDALSKFFGNNKLGQKIQQQQQQRDPELEKIKAAQQMAQQPQM